MKKFFWQKGKSIGFLCLLIISVYNVFKAIPYLWDYFKLGNTPSRVLLTANKDSVLAIVTGTYWEYYLGNTYIMGIFVGSHIILVGLVFAMAFNIKKRKMVEKELLESNEQLTALYEELEASDEELRNQFDIIQESKENLRRSRERYKYVFLASNEGLWDIDVSNDTIYISKEWYKNFLGEQYHFDTPNIKDWFSIIHPKDFQIVKNVIHQIENAYPKKITCEYRVYDINNNIIWIEQNCILFYDTVGNLTRIIGSLTNITTKKLQENNIKKLAYSDTLTKLPNRLVLQEKLSKVVVQNKGHGAIMFLDVDNFKYVNDTYGHIIGDKVLIEIGKRLKTLKNSNINIYRFGGDEFVILIHNEQAIEAIKKIADQIIALFQKKYVIDQKEFYLTTSIGVSVYPSDGIDPNNLLKDADSAMYKAKETGKNKYIFFNKEMNKEIADKLYIYNHLRTALENNEFTLHYQPQIDLKTNGLIGFEALIRWKTKDFGEIPPMKFITIAEESDMIIKIGDWVLKEACQFAKEVNQGTNKYVISINVSANQLREDDFVEKVIHTIDEAKISPDHIGIEITETALMNDFAMNAKKIYKLKKMGIQTSLDDFGTGYSSLNYLRQLPINTLKIDKSFIGDLLKNDKVYNLTEDIILISQKLGFMVVAEGVELKQQQVVLEQYQCDVIQGYLISKPLTKAKALEFSHNHLFNDVI
ncbi:diguanylate cyclase (GGDEF)-like protein [Natranaerovirga hydrolytica]|uniref:Diguanylate cyclase (GGDEF)-like protein n=1 Tax=Natranaerovirga hydrolytica TaxID=680378 RepID=A0A4R1MIC8_9FIRM|nr:GGDEF domain-containing phosphodiesterase [Natranaerovirga hydrolytica]TCK92376.1 diguanylate cyclase (GGDEF)-like protein [Natranaerovirga hydrolytica]